MIKRSKHDLRQLKKFVYWRSTNSSTRSLTVRNRGSKHDFLQLKNVVNELSTYSLCAESVMNKAWKHDLLRVMKFMYWRSTCCFSLLNMGSKHDLRQLKEFVYFALDLQSFVPAIASVALNLSVLLAYSRCRP